MEGLPIKDTLKLKDEKYMIKALDKGGRLL